MTDLNPTPNPRWEAGGVVGYGNIVAGVAVIAAGLVMAIEPLTWVGVFLAGTGIVLVAAQLLRRRKKDGPRSSTYRRP